MGIDNFDKKILKILQKDNKIKQSEIAKRVNLSVSAVNRRIASLEKDGIIKENICVVDSQKVGMSITVIVEIHVVNEQLDLLEEVKKRFIECRNVQQVYYVTGESDFILIINVKDMTEYEKLTRELFFTSKNIKKFKTIVAMQTAKQSLEVVIP